MSKTDPFKFIEEARTTKDLERIKTLSKMDDVEVRGKLARNPFVPVKILKKLANDCDLWVVEGACGNPEFPRDSPEFTKYISQEW